MNGADRPEAAHAQRSMNGSPAHGGPGLVPKLKLLDVAAMVTTPPEPVPWLVEGLIMRGGVTLLAGLAGRGKSLLAQALATAATQLTGGSVAGMAVRPARVLVVDAENGQPEIHRRVRSLGLTPEGVDRLHIVEAEGFHLDRDLDDLARVIAELQPDLVVLDGFRSLWPSGDENKSDEVTQVLARLRSLVRRHNVGALLIHHSPKSGQTYRGSSAIAAGVELAFVLERVDDDDDSARRRLRCEKCRPAPEPPDLWLRLASGDELARGFSAIGEAEPFIEPMRERAPVRTALASDLVALVAMHGPLRRAELARLANRQPSDGTVRRAVERAVEDGQLVHGQDGLYELASQPDNLAGNGIAGVASQSDVYGSVAVGKSAPLGEFTS